MGYFKNPLELSVGLAASPGVFTSSLRFPQKELRAPSSKGPLPCHFNTTREVDAKLSFPPASPTVSQPPGKCSLPPVESSPWPTSSPLSLGRHPGPRHHPSPWDVTRPTPSPLSLGRHPSPRHHPSPWDVTPAHTITPLPGTSPRPMPSPLSLDLRKV